MGEGGQIISQMESGKKSAYITLGSCNDNRRKEADTSWHPREPSSSIHHCITGNEHSIV